MSGEFEPTYVYVVEQSDDEGLEAEVTGVYRTLDAACHGMADRFRPLGDDLWLCGMIRVTRWELP